LLILEIALTVVAWLRGWWWWALLPLGMGLATGFLVGLVVTMIGGSEALIDTVALLIDVAVIVMLVLMIFRPRRTA